MKGAMGFQLCNFKLRLLKLGPPKCESLVFRTFGLKVRESLLKDNLGNRGEHVRAQREEELIYGASYAPIVTLFLILMPKQGFLLSILSICNVLSLISMK